MRRLLAVLVLSAFSADPALGATCLRACSEHHPAAEPQDSCHRPAVPQQRVADGHDCSNHATPIPLVAKRIDPAAQLLTAVADDVRTASAIATAQFSKPRFERFAPSSPLLLYLTPLRI